MSAASNYLEKKLLDHTLRYVGPSDSNTFVPPTTLYLGLFRNTSGNAATNLEAGTLSDEVGAGVNYARKPVTFAAANSTTGVIATSATVTFDEASASWDTITHVAIMDALTSGNVLFWGAVTTPKAIEAGDTFQITSGSLTITLA